MPALDTLIPRFKAADRQTRLETLLDYSKKLPPLPERYEAEKAQGTTWWRSVRPRCISGSKWTRAGCTFMPMCRRESPTVRGFVSLLARTLDGETPDAVSRLPLDLLDQLGLSEALGMTRTQGLTAILHRVKSSVASATS